MFSRISGGSHVAARHGALERRSLMALLGSRRARLVPATHGGSILLACHRPQDST